MQRDIDLVRQMLLDVERRGAACPIDSLRTDSRHDVDERIRYHLRLLTDAALVKETGQTATGTPCVRLTHAGQEFLELARCDVRWNEAKAAVLAATGGVPLTMLRALLVRWAWRSVTHYERRRAVRRRYHRYVERVAPETWLDAYAVDPDAVWDDQPAQRLRDRRIPADWEPDLYGDVAAELAGTTAAPRSPTPNAGLPEQLI